MIAAFLFAKTQQTAVSEIRSISMSDKELRRLSRTDLQPRTSTWRTSGSRPQAIKIQNPQTVRRMKAFRNEEKD